jgi:citrate synthase
MSDEKVRTRIWLEEPEADNPYATRTAYCHGYDVYGEMLGRARWTEMLYLLFRGQAPTPEQTRLLDTLALALANPGPRDASVHAAMCGGVGGSPAAASLMAALAAGAGQNGGAREVFTAMQGWLECSTDVDAWRKWFIAVRQPGHPGVWSPPEHAPGFEPYGVSTATIVLRTLATLAALSEGPHLAWLADTRTTLETLAAVPLAMSGVAAAAFTDLGFIPEQGEALYLILRLPGAAAHALEQRDQGYKKFPFYPIELEDDPATRETLP